MANRDEQRMIGKLMADCDRWAAQSAVTDEYLNMLARTAAAAIKTRPRGRTLAVEGEPGGVLVVVELGGRSGVPHRGDGSALEMPRIDHTFGVRVVSVQVRYTRSF